MIDTGQGRLAVPWLITATGAGIFVTIQSFTLTNDVVQSGGARPAATLEPLQMWTISAFYGAWVVPALLALVPRSSANYAMLIVGGFLVVLNTLSGIFDGIRDGGHLIFLALLAITLPGSFATITSWRNIRTA